MVHTEPKQILKFMFISPKTQVKIHWIKVPYYTHNSLD